MDSTSSQAFLQAFHNYDLDFERLLLLKDFQVEAIADIVGSIVPPTPLANLDTLASAQVARVSVKREEQTPAGSFKMRGAAYILHCIAKQFQGRVTRLFAASTGNHGISLALIGQAMNLPITIVAPKSIPISKQTKLRGLGVDLIIRGHFLDDALEFAKSLAAARGGLFIDSTDHRLVLGHATFGLELFAAAPDLDYVFFPIGAGAGIAGLTLARGWRSPRTKIVGVVPEACAAWLKSRQVGKSVYSQPTDTLADGLRTARPEENLFRFLNQNLDDIICVGETKIHHAIDLMTTNLGVVPEGAGAVGLAGLLQYSELGRLRGLHAATVLCGSQQVPLKPLLSRETALS